MAESGDSEEKNWSQEAEDEAAKREEEKKKARLRRRGPYRKAHADW